MEMQHSSTVIIPRKYSLWHCGVCTQLAPSQREVKDLPEDSDNKWQMPGSALWSVRHLSVAMTSLFLLRYPFSAFIAMSSHPLHDFTITNTHSRFPLQTVSLGPKWLRDFHMAAWSLVCLFSLYEPRSSQSPLTSPPQSSNVTNLRGQTCVYMCVCMLELISTQDLERFLKSTQGKN